MSDAEDFMGGDAGVSAPGPSIEDRANQYAHFIETAAKLVMDGVAPLDGVSSADLPVSDERLQQCVGLTIDAMDEQDEAPSQSDLARSPAEIDWVAVFDEFGFWETSGYPGASYTQLAGALATSDHTGYRAGDSIGRQGLKEVVDQAVQIGELQPIRPNEDIVGFYPKGGRPDE
jgi:hypothetical protein